MATHNWPDMEPEFVEFAAGSDYADSIVAANRSQWDEEMDEPSNVVRIAPPGRQRILVGGGWLRKAWLIVRDSWRFIAGPSALVRVKRNRKARP